MNIGFIGAGNMGSAVAKAVADAGYFCYIYDRHADKATSTASLCRGKVATLKEIKEKSDFVFLGIKPQGLEISREELAPFLEGKIVVSMLAGKKCCDVEAALNARVIRIMPNTPIFCNEGVVLYCHGDNITEADINAFCSIMSKCGMLTKIGEDKIDAANNKFSHAYLFCGSRGTGKTSCAKILSRAVNCLDSKNGNPCGKCSACLSIENGSATDVLEMDAASNNGVDNIRDIRDEVVYTPSSLKYRVYIIDEVHMLSQSAFNALLKTLEEPPEHVIFILATTELHKLPATIISRCQRFDFRRITTKVLRDRLLHIAKNEEIEIEDSAAQLIARQAQGGMRDAISLLELCAGSRVKITDALVHDSIGSTGRGELIRLCEAVISRDFDEIFEIISTAVNSSRDIVVFWQELLALYRDLLIVKISSRPSEYLDLTDSEANALKSLASKMTQETLSYHCSLVEDAYLTMQKSNTVKRIVAELTLVRMCEPRLSGSMTAALDRISDLEQKVKNVSVGVAVSSVEATEEKEKPVERKPTAKKTPKFDDDEDFRSDAPSVQKPKAPAAANNRTKRILKPFKNRAEVLEQLNNVDPMNASFFAESKWYTDEEGKIVLKFSSAYTLDTIKIFNGDTQIIEVFSRTLGKQYTKNTVLFECDSTDGKKDVIDEILLNSEE